MNNFSKSVYLGRVAMGEGRTAPVHARIEFRDGRLSISGVIGAKRNGDASGSSGQCADEIRGAEFVTRAAGWDEETVARFLGVWDKWHLNDMRAGCEHQRAGWDTGEPLEVTSWMLTMEACRLRRSVEESVKDAAAAGETLPPISAAERYLLGRDWHLSHPPAEVLALGLHEVAKVETKAAGWVTPDEHPRGLLCKPCEVCGYKYGSAWLREEAPTEVLAFLSSLPDAAVPCPWGSM